MKMSSNSNSNSSSSAGASGGGSSSASGSGGSSSTFVDKIDPFAKRSLKKKQKKSQGSSRYRTGGDVELQALPLLKGKKKHHYNHHVMHFIDIFRAFVWRCISHQG